MLIGAGSILNRQPMRFFGGGVAADRVMWTRGERNNIFAGEGQTDDKGSVPDGVRHPMAWVMPLKPGGMASRGEIIATATFTGAGALGRNIDATSSGVGSLTVSGQLVVSATASIDGVATVTSNAFAALLATASIAGSGGLLSGGKIQLENGDFLLLETGDNFVQEASGANLTALGWGVVAITGTATVTGTRYATGDLEADITPFTELSPQSLASAVWAELLESGYSAGDIMRVMSAALAGEVSGAGTATVTIRDIADAKDRIVASVDGTGNRTAVTLDAA